MFENFKRMSVESEAMHSLRLQEEQFDTFMEEHRVQFNKAMESHKKASALMMEVIDFTIILCTTKQNPTQYEQSKSKLKGYLLAVQEDEALKHNAEVQELVNDIYKDMDDKDAMVKIISRLEALISKPQIPDILSSLNLNF